MNQTVETEQHSHEFLEGVGTIDWNELHIVHCAVRLCLDIAGILRWDDSEHRRALVTVQMASLFNEVPQVAVGKPKADCKDSISLKDKRQDPFIPRIAHK